MSNEIFKQTYDYIKSIEDFKQSDLILDAGCGSGELVSLFSEDKFNIVGFDSSENLIKRAMEINPGSKFYVDNLVTFENTDNQFDVILINNAFFYIHPKIMKQSLSNISQRLKPNGRLLILEVPDYNKRVNWKKGSIHRLSSRFFGVFNAYMASFWIKDNEIEHLAKEVGFTSFEKKDTLNDYRSSYILIK